MKKWLLVALMVMAAMLVCVAGAGAAAPDYSVTAISKEIPNLPSTPTAPDFDLSVKNGGYILTTDWHPVYADNAQIGIEADSTMVWLTYDEGQNAWISDHTLTLNEKSTATFYDKELHPSPDGTTIEVNVSTKEISSIVITSHEGERRDEGSAGANYFYYQWDSNDSIVQYRNVYIGGTSNQELGVYAEYRDGILESYHYTTPDGAGVYYFPDGTLSYINNINITTDYEKNEYLYFNAAVEGNPGWYDGTMEPGWYKDVNWELVACDRPDGIDLGNYPPLIIVDREAVETTPLPTAEPTSAPTDEPTVEPTAAPSNEATSEPTPEATPAPTAESTCEPTAAPSNEATSEPTPEATPAPTAEPTPTPTPSPYTWYSHNTQGLVGLPLRDLYPDLTDKWYNVVPVDLTVQGRQAYPLVASNLFHMGTAYVDILGDSVTVTYKTPGNKWTAYLAVEDEALAWFTAPGDITAEFLENPAGEVAFGEPVSISESLNGQDVALLFICNHVTYRQPCLGNTGYLTRYWPNLPEWKEYREGLMMLLERMGE